MKKQLFLCFAMLLCAGVLAGCASDEPLVWSGGRFRWLRLAVLPSPAVGVRRIRATRGNSRRSRKTAGEDSDADFWPDFCQRLFFLELVLE